MSAEAISQPPIVLIGYRATGKTSLARALAERLGWDWIDADVEIERRAGKPIAQIFAQDGESVFRDWEAAVMQDLLAQQRLVIASGGGAPLRPETRLAMQKTGRVVWLKASPETIHRRMTADPTTESRRPALTSFGGLEEIRQLLAQREPIYHQTATLEIDTENKPIPILAEEILRRLGLEPKGSSIA